MSCTVKISCLRASVVSMHLSDVQGFGDGWYLFGVQMVIAMGLHCYDKP
jgi:hypothetical protein